MSQEKPTVICRETIRRIEDAGYEIVDRLHSEAFLPNHRNGYLSILTEWGVLIGRTYLGPQITLREAKGWCGSEESCRYLYEKRTTEDGHTSSDISSKKAGAVYTRGLIVGYFDNDSKSEPMANEAIAIMTAFRAGLLTPDQIWHRHTDPLSPKYNTWLEDLLISFGHKQATDVGSE